VRGNTRRLGESTLWALDPSVQGRGLATARRVADFRVRDATCDFSYSSAVTPHPTSAHLRAKYPRPAVQLVANGLQVLFLPLNLRRFIAGSEAEGGETGGRTRVALEAAAGIKPKPAPLRMAWWGSQMLAARVRRRRRPQRLSDFSLTTITRFDERVTALVEDAAPTFDLMRARDVDWLNWRFCDPRAGHFTVRVAQEGDDLLGYAVSKNNRGAQLADLLVRPGRLDVAAALLQDTIDRARAEGADSLRLSSPRSHPYAGLARDVFGFIPQRNAGGGDWSAWGPHADEFNFFADPAARLHRMMGDRAHV
jgi:hypothetical protein